MIGLIFTDAAAATLRQYAGRIHTCLGKLNEEQVWTRGSESENSVGNLVLHLCGNLRQYTRHAIAGDPDIRLRDDEFNAEGGLTIEELRKQLGTVVDDAIGVISAVTEERLAEQIVVQNREMTVLATIFKTTEHFALHTGQIMYATKLFTHQELGFFTHKRVGA